jgi:hypothetical protein
MAVSNRERVGRAFEAFAEGLVAELDGGVPQNACWRRAGIVDLGPCPLAGVGEGEPGAEVKTEFLGKVAAFFAQDYR